MHGSTHSATLVSFPADVVVVVIVVLHVPQQMSLVCDMWLLMCVMHLIASTTLHGRIVSGGRNLEKKERGNLVCGGYNIYKTEYCLLCQGTLILNIMSTKT